MKRFATPLLLAAAFAATPLLAQMPSTPVVPPPVQGASPAPVASPTSSVATGEASYVEPNVALLTTRGQETIPLTKEERQKLANWVCVAVRQLDQPATKNAQNAARWIGLALWLDPDSRSAAVLNSQMKLGATPRVGDPIHPAVLATQFITAARIIRSTSNNTNENLAAYLTELAAIQDPANEDALYQMEMDKRKGLGSWDTFASRPGAVASVPGAAPVAAPSGGSATSSTTTAIASAPAGATPGSITVNGVTYPASGSVSNVSASSPVSYPTAAPAAAPVAPPSGGTPNPKRGQTKIHGLVVSYSDGTRIGGKTIDIISTAQPGGSGVTAAFSREVAADMRTSMAEALRTVLLRPESSYKAATITVSFDDKYTSMGGGSAGTAFGVTFASLLEGFEIDPSVAMTGDITVDGVTRKVGGVAHKIRGASYDKMKYVAIPLSNEESVGELALLYSISDIWNIQVFAITSLDEAVAIARTDRPPNLAKAMDLFSKLQTALNSPDRPSLRSPEIVAQLKAVLELAPNHLSAKYLLMAGNGTMPRQLSTMSSLEAMNSAAAPLLAALKQVKEKTITEIPDSVYTLTDRQMADVEKIINPQARDVFAALNSLTMAIQGALSRVEMGASPTQTQAAISEINRAFAAYDASIDKLGADKELREQLLHDR